MKSIEILNKLNTVLKPDWFTLEDINSWIDEEPEWDTNREYSVIDIADADTPRKLNESSLGRVYKHFLNMKEKGKSFAILTSYRKAITSEDHKKNKETFKILKSEVKKWGFFELLGHGQEDVDGEETKVIEPSLFVVNISMSDALKLAKKHEQYGIQYAGPETEGNVWLCYSDGGHKNEGPFHPNKIAKYYSVVKGKPFVFESKLINETWIEGKAAHLHGIKEVVGIRKAEIN